MVNAFSACSGYLHTDRICTIWHTAYSISDSGKLGVNSWDLEALARIIKMRVMPRGVNELLIGYIKTALISLFRFRKNITDSKSHCPVVICSLKDLYGYEPF